MYTAEKYLWWSDAEKKLADEVADFSDNVISRDIDEIERTKKFLHLLKQDLLYL